MSGGVLVSSVAAVPEDWQRSHALTARAMLLLQAAIWIGMFVLFLASPVLQMSDSQYSMLTAESIIHHHTPDLSGYSIKNYEADLPFNEIRGKHAYQLVRVNGKLLYGFPHGNSLLSLPFVALMDVMGVSPATRNGKYDLAGEMIDQKMLAALLMASLVVIFFRTALLQLDWRWSAIIAACAGLGSQVWSTGSRGMWSQTWEMTLAGLLVYLLLRSEAERTSIRPVIVATLLSWMFFVRPTASGPILCVSLYVLFFHRREFTPYAITGMLWLVAFATYSLGIFGTPFPPYYQQLWGKDAHWIAVGIFGSLFSPSRGLFVYCPALLVVFYLLIRHWRALASRRLAILAVSSSVGVLLMVASHFDWWGGNCYGPRYLSDTVPWMVLLGILAIAAIPETLRSLRNPALALAAVLLAVGVTINAHGAFSSATLDWNLTQRPLPDALLDWSRPQFLAGWMDEP
jgi:hypothetical protein